MEQSPSLSTSSGGKHGLLQALEGVLNNGCHGTSEGPYPRGSTSDLTPWYHGLGILNAVSHTEEHSKAEFNFLHVTPESSP